MTDGDFLIWSIEHGAWWAPDRRGYTLTLSEAGRYSETDARAIVRQANRPAGLPRARRDNDDNEVAIPESAIVG